MPCFKCLFHIDNHVDKLCCHICCNIFKRKYFIKKHLQNNQLIFLTPCGRYQVIKYILQNPNISWNAMGFNNHNLSRETLQHRALNKIRSFLNYFILHAFQTHQTILLEYFGQRPIS